MAVNPADLDARVRDALGELRDLRRLVVELSREYAVLDADGLGVDDLGVALSPADALAGVRESLAGVDRALAAADDAFDPALAASSRLFRRSGVGHG